MTTPPATAVSRPRFLGPDATPAQLVQATARNHTAWMTEGARASGGGVCRRGGAVWD